MKITIDVSQFRDAFTKIGRDKFSYEGLKVLFEYLESVEEETGEEMELDPIALCCEFTEFESLEEVKNSYDRIETLEDLQDKTQVIEFGDGKLIIQNF